MSYQITQFQEASSQDLFQISLESARATSKEVFIFELGSMSDLFSQEKAEQVRQEFLRNNVKVRQISNTPTIPAFTKNQEFIDSLMQFRYVPKDIFTISQEVLIFDDVVAIYSSTKILVIRDSQFANAQKELFLNIWQQGQSPKVGFDYVPNHSFYNCITLFVNNLQVIVWPDADAKESYAPLGLEALKSYLAQIISSDSYFDDASYLIVFIWNMNGDRMADIWKFTSNHVDDRSGPLGDVRVYREGKRCYDLGLASGNTLLVLGSEEKLRRQSANLQAYLDGPVPKLPLEVMNGKELFS